MDIQQNDARKKPLDSVIAKAEAKVIRVNTMPKNDDSVRELVRE